MVLLALQTHGHLGFVFLFFHPFLGVTVPFYIPVDKRSFLPDFCKLDLVPKI